MRKGLKKQYVMGWDDAAMGAASLIPAAFKYFEGRKQEKLANKYASTPRPKYDIPKGIYENQSIARNLAGSRMAGEGFLRNRLDRILSGGTANAVNAGQSSSQILNTVSDIAGKEMDAEAGITAKSQAWHDQQVKGLMGQNQVMSNYDDKKWDWNQKQPYTDAMAASSALRNSSLQNKYGALSDASKSLLGVFMGGKGESTPTPGQNEQSMLRSLDPNYNPAYRMSKKTKQVGTEPEGYNFMSDQPNPTIGIPQESYQ